MVLDYTETRKIKIEMRDYIKKILSNLPKSFSGSATTPAANHLFEIRDNVKKLSEYDTILFHHVVAQLLFLCKRERPDLQTAVAFLTTRVTAPDEDDIKK